MNQKILFTIIAISIICLAAAAFSVKANQKSMDNTNSNTTSSTQNCNIKYDSSIKTFSSYPPFCVDKTKDYTGTIETNMGNINFTLFTSSAPLTVNSFYFLTKSGYFDGLTFHRVVKDFVIQGGDPKGDGTGGPGYSFADEINAKSLGLSQGNITQNEQQGYKYDDSLKSYHVTKGVLAMANSGPNTNGSQFFIPVTDQSQSLDGKYTVFGQVTGGMDVVDKIDSVSVDGSDKPLTPVVINKITIN